MRRLWIGPASASRLLASLIFVAVLALVACAGNEGQPAGDLASESLRADAAAPILIPPGKPIVVGVSVPLTGPDTAVGREDLAGAITAVARWKRANGAQILGHEIEVRAEDDGCTDARITVQAAERLLRREGLVAVLGPDCSAGAAEAIPIFEKAGVVAISGSATRTDLTLARLGPRFFFRTAYRNDLQGTLIGLFASAELRGKSAYIVDDGEAYGIDLADAGERAMKESGVSVTRESLPRGTVDFSELAERVKNDNPTFVGFAGFNPEAALFYRQLRDAGYTGGFGAGDAAASVPDFVRPVGKGAEGVLFSGCSPDLPDDFVSDFADVHGSEPEASTFVAHYADAATVLLDAIHRTAKAETDGGISIDPLELAQAVRSRALTDGLSGPIAFDDNGDRVPASGDRLEDIMRRAIEQQDITVFPRLGLVPCQVQAGRLINLLSSGDGVAAQH